MENFSKIILIAILIITTGNLARNFFGDNSLKKVEENLEKTKQSLDSAITSNTRAQKEIVKMDSTITDYKDKNEILQAEIDIIDFEKERTRVATLKRREQIDSLIKARKERILVLKSKDAAFD